MGLFLCFQTIVSVFVHVYFYFFYLFSFSSFGILKARWSILTSIWKLKYKSKAATAIFESCCVLHNWCLLYSEVWPREDELPINHHKEYCNISTSGSLPTGHTAFPGLMAEAQRNALMCALQEAHAVD